jgi:competence protein ComGC
MRRQRLWNPSGDVQSRASVLECVRRSEAKLPLSKTVEQSQPAKHPGANPVDESGGKPPHSKTLRADSCCGGNVRQHSSRGDLASRLGSTVGKNSNAEPMKATDYPKLRQGTAFTKIELLAVLAVIALAVAMMVPSLARAKAKANRVSCVSNLKCVGLAFRIFATDRGGAFPWQLSTNQGSDEKIGPGTKEFASNASDLWRHFAILSNELPPKIIHCYSDKERRAVLRWTNASNLNLSYFAGLGASQEQSQSILSGDRNLLLDGRSLSNEVVHFGSRTNVAFDQRIHVEVGNLLLGDGSVQQVSNARLRDQFHDTSLVSTNTLVFP